MIGGVFRHWLRVPAPPPVSSHNPAVPTSRVLVFGKFPNPTFDYYFAARLAAPGMPPFELRDIRGFDPSSLKADGTFVIIVRYASKAMTGWIRNNRDNLAGVALFVDDDIAGVVTGREASLAYRYRLMRQSLLPLRALDGVIDELWVSTEILATRLAYARPRILPPAPALDMPETLLPAPSPGDSVTIAYHATAIHVEEHRFLLPVVCEILAAFENVRFEVFAEGGSASLWRSLGHELGQDRVTVRKPLPWPDYLAESRKRKVEIMVVPVASGHVNDCRAETKRIDIARLGAAAVLSDCPAFADVEEGEILLPYDGDIWSRRLAALVSDPEARRSAAMATRRRVERMAAEAEAGIEAIVQLSAP